MHHFPPPNAVDIGALVLLILGTILGFRRGLSGEIARFVGTIAAFVLGYFLYSPTGAWLVDHTRLSTGTANVTAFILIVALVLLGSLLIRLVLRSIMKISFEGNIEKAGGCISGFIRYAILVLIIFIAMNLVKQEFLNRVFGKESVIGSVVVRFIPEIKEQVEKLPVKEKVEDLREKISEEIE